MRSKKRLAPLAAIAVAAIALSACGSSGSTPKSNPTGQQTNGSGAFQTGSPSASASASAAALGPVPVVTVGQEQAPSNFNDLDTDGNAAETLLDEEGVLPFAYRGQLNVTEDWDRNLFVDAPALTNKSPETITYHINPKAVWSDGKPIDASDFNYSFITENGANPKYNAASTNGYANIASVTGSGTNNQTVTVVFKTPYADWQGLFAPLLPAHLLAPLGVDGFNNAMTKGISVNGGTPFSGGPYIQSDYKAGDHITLTPNPTYWGPAPKVAKVVFRYIEDTTQFPTALANNELDLVNPQPTADEVQKTQAVSRLTTKLYPQVVFEHIDYNFKNPFLSDKQVRLAISTAIDIKGVIAGTIGQFAPDTVPLGNHIVLNNQAGYVNNAGAQGTGDSAGAAKLLEADGYAKSGDYYAKGGKTLEVSITCKNGNPLRLQEEQLMQAQLKKAGIKLDIKNTDKSIGEFTAAHAYDIALFAWVGNPLFSSNQSIYATPPKGADTQNTQFYSNPAVDSAFNDAVADLDPTDALAKYNAIDKLIYADAATLPLFQKAGFLAFPKTLGNVQANPTQDGYSYNIGEWGAVTSS